MIVFENEQVICCDIDDTLVLWGDFGQTKIEIPCPYQEGFKEQLELHQPHLKIVRDRLERGALMIVWSAAGYAWARNVLQTLGFENYSNIHVYSKPVAYIDDKKCNLWMGERIYLPPTSPYGARK